MKFNDEGFYASDEKLAEICRQSIQEEFKRRRAIRRAAQEEGKTPQYGHFNISDRD